MQSTSIYGTKPQNFAIIDQYLSRSAQPIPSDFKWIKQQRVTDVINFRTAAETSLEFDEKNVVNNLGMRYLSIPSITAKPEERNIINFLNLIEQIKGRRGKAHIHCKAGADRTGMYSFIYKGIKKIGNTSDNLEEWLKFGHNRTLLPKLIPWTQTTLKRLRKQYK